MNKKLLCIISAVLGAIILCVFVIFISCNGCDTEISDVIKSDTGVTVTGGDFEKDVQLVAEKLKLNDGEVMDALKLLPDKMSASDQSEIAVMDISVRSGDVKVQPNGKVKVAVPAPLEGVEDYMVFHIKGKNEVEELPCEYKDGKVSFETDSFSLFVFGASVKRHAVTVKVVGVKEGNVDILVWEYFSYMTYSLTSGEQKTVYAPDNNFTSQFEARNEEYSSLFAGWYNEVDGKMENEPFSTEQVLDLQVTEDRVIVAKFVADLTGFSYTVLYPGESGIPSGYKDGSIGHVLYVKNGNPDKINLDGVEFRGYREMYFGKGVYVPIPKEYYDVEGLDKVDYNKDGHYVVTYTMKETQLTSTLHVYVTSKIVDLTARTMYGGKFYVGNDTRLFETRKFKDQFVGMKHILTAVPDEKFDFDGWYECFDGGVVGKLLSNQPRYEFIAQGKEAMVIARFRIKPEYSEKRGVYMINLLPGKSGIPVDKNGHLSYLYYRPGLAEIDLTKIEVEGIRRTSNGYESVPLYYGDYTVDYDEMNFTKEGTYWVNFDSPNTNRRLVFISISEKHANITAGFEGNGRLIVNGDEKNPILSGKYNSRYFRLQDEKIIKAVPDVGNKFAGWYSIDAEGNRSEQPISLDTEYIFEQNGQDVNIIAVFEYNFVNVNMGISGVGDIYMNGQKLSFSTSHEMLSMGTIEKGSTVTLRAVPGKMSGCEYEFFAWATDYENNSQSNIVSYNAEYFIENVTEPINIYAVFVAKLSKIVADGYDAGFDEDGVFHYSLILQQKPDMQQIVVRGFADPENDEQVYVLGSLEYEVDASAVDYTKTGEYPITITLKRDTSVKCTLTVSVPGYTTYSYMEESEDFMIHGCIRKGDVTVVNSPDGYYEEVGIGKTLTLTAVADDDYKFDGWYIVYGNSDEKQFYSANATETFTINSDTYIYAKFVEKKEVELNAYALEYGKVYSSDPDGGAEALDSVKAVVKEGEKVKVYAKASYDYSKFAGWYDGADENAKLISEDKAYEFTVNENMNVYARFALSFIVEASIEGVGEFVDNPGETHVIFDNLPNNSFVPITVKEKEGYAFVGWFDANEGFFVGGDLTYVAKVYVNYGDISTGNLHLVARFRKTVTDIKLQVNDTSGFDTDIEGNIITEYKLGLNQMFYAQPENLTVLGKTGDQYEKLVRQTEYKITSTIGYNDGLLDTSVEGVYTITYTYLKDPSVKAVITIRVAEMFNFIAYSNYGEVGMILENGEKAEFGNGRHVDKGTKITLTAQTNDQYYEFIGWIDQSTQTPKLISTDAEYTFTVNGHMSILAEFAAKPVFNAFIEGNGYIKENGEMVEFGNGRPVNKGTKITLTAEAAREATFIGWFGGENFDVKLSGEQTWTFTINDNMNVMAKFRGGIIKLRHNAQGSTTIDDTTIINVELGGQYRFAPEDVEIYAEIYGTSNDMRLVLHEDYTIDYGGLNYGKAGLYTVTYTVIYQPEKQLKFIVRVLGEGDYENVWLHPGQEYEYIGEDGNGDLIVDYIIGENTFDITKIVLEASVVGQDSMVTWKYNNGYTIDNGGWDSTKPEPGTYIVKFIPTACPELYRIITLKVHNVGDIHNFTELIMNDSGFSRNNSYELVAEYAIGGNGVKPDASKITVTGTVYGDQNTQTFELGTHYVIDNGDLDFTVPGTYTIKIKAISNPECVVELYVRVYKIN